MPLYLLWNSLWIWYWSRCDICKIWPLHIISIWNVKKKKKKKKTSQHCFLSISNEAVHYFLIIYSSINCYWTSNEIVFIYWFIANIVIWPHMVNHISGRHMWAFLNQVFSDEHAFMFVFCMISGEQIFSVISDNLS